MRNYLKELYTDLLIPKVHKNIRMCRRSLESGSHVILGHLFRKFSIKLSIEKIHGTVTIGERCWIGSNVTILKGSKIGNNCVIGAGCVISGKVPNNSIVRLKQTVEIEEIQYR